MMRNTSSNSTSWFRTRVPRGTLIAGLAAIAVVASGCAAGTDKGDGPPPSPVENEQSTPANESAQNESGPTEQSPEEAADESDAEDVTDGALEDGWTSEDSEVERPSAQGDNTFITGLRVGEHAGFDRVVVDFAGPGPLGYTAFWTDNPTEQGRGERLDLDGDTFLSVNITGVSFPISDKDYEVYYGDSDKYWIGDITAIYDSSFEGQAHVAIGMIGKHPYRVFTLEDPTRVVIDVQK